MLSELEFLKQIKSKNTIVLQRSFLLDLGTAVSLASKFLDEDDFCFLEGVDKDRQSYSLSYIAFNAFSRIKVLDKNTIQVTQHGRTQTIKQNLYPYIKDFIKTHQLENVADQTLDFHAGVLGFLSYECVQFLENIRFPSVRQLGLPLAQLMVPKTVMVFNNKNNHLTVNHVIFSEEWENKDPVSVFRSQSKDFEQMIARVLEPTLHQSVVLPMESTPYNLNDIEFNVNERQYIQMVKKCQEYIRTGHIFQIQISRRAQSKAHAHPFDLYRLLRNTNPSPFMFYVKLDDAYLIGSSPEILVGVQDKKVTIRPLAGTRRRYSSKQTEQAIVEELMNDEKERAEHIMLVDLARHDVGQSCVPGTIEVTELMAIEKYQHVIHIVSNVQGELHPKYTAVDAFKYGFPAGTVSGAPKVRAMEIISDLEKVQREFYSGSIVFFDFLDNLKSTLIIRSLCFKDNCIYTQAAAGIVADSDPKLEFLETQNKMKTSVQVMGFKSS